MSDDIHPLALRDVQRDDAIPLTQSIATLRHLAAHFCFETRCVRCGKVYSEGEAHQCSGDNVTSPFCECRDQGAPTRCGGCT